MSTTKDSGLHRQSLHFWYSFKTLPDSSSKITDIPVTELVRGAMFDLVKDAHQNIPSHAAKILIAGEAHYLPRWQLLPLGAPVTTQDGVSLSIVFRASARFSPKQIKALKEVCEQCANQIALAHAVSIRLERIESETEIHQFVTKTLDKYM